MSNDFPERAFATMWRLDGMDYKMELVSTTDIGILAAEAFRAQAERARNATSFATDELTPREANKMFKENCWH